MIKSKSINCVWALSIPMHLGLVTVTLSSVHLSPWQLGCDIPGNHGNHNATDMITHNKHIMYCRLWINLVTIWPVEPQSLHCRLFSPVLSQVLPCCVMSPAFTMKDIKKVHGVFLFHTFVNRGLGRRVFLQVSKFEFCEIWGSDSTVAEDSNQFWYVMLCSWLSKTSWAG